jgi:hypothetical protein
VSDPQVSWDATPATPPPPPSVEWDTPPQASAFQRLGESALSGAGVVSDEQGKNFFIHPVDTLKAMANLQGELGKRAAKELENKDYVRGLRHGIEWLIPGLGPTLARAGDQLESGDIAGGTGTTLGAAASLLAGAKAPAIADAAADAAANIADKIPGKAVITAPVRAGARATEAVANSKLKPFVKLMTPADEAAKIPVKIPGRDFGLPKPAAAAAEPPVYPGADLPTATPEQINPSLVSPARTLPGMNSPEVVRPPAQPIPSRSGLMLPGEVEQPKVAAPSVSPEAAPVEWDDEVSHGTSESIPRTLSGESALRQVLDTQPLKTLQQIARSRGINITQESQLRADLATPKVINKIVSDFAEDELDGFRSTYLENTRMPRHDFGDIGKEANQTLNLQTYFPEIKISPAQLARTVKAIAATKATVKPPALTQPVPSTGGVDDLTAILQESVKRAQATQ